MNKIRAPILTTLGHVDHGKTTLLDSIRGTTVAQKEPGQITQLIGCSFIPVNVIEKLCGKLLDRFKIKLTIPGLLIIDTPGHEAFTTLRKRGGTISDLAILVIDINEGFKPQTNESLNFLKDFKTPFLVAATKIDAIPGWFSEKNASFLDIFNRQRDDVKEEVETKIYDLVAQLSQRGFESERFDRVTDFKKQITIVPCSGKTGEGVAELLMMLAGLAQQFLKERLALSKKSRGTVLEVKEVKGLGMTIDAIIYDGSVRVGDYLVIGGKKIIATKIKALLRPPALRELRIEKKFDHVRKVDAAAGIKISAPNLENVIAGSPIVCVSDKSKVKEAEESVKKEIEEVEFSKDVEGVIAKADTLGSLEALINILKENQIPIRKAEIGKINREDVVELDPIKDEAKRVVLGFNVGMFPEAEETARDLNIKVFLNNIIYKLIEDYQEWYGETTERKKKEKLERVVRASKLRVLPGFVFRKAKPAVFGVEILAGVLKTNTPMKTEEGKDIGKVKQIQKQGKNIDQAKTGDKVAVSMNEPTIGRQIKEGDILVSVITSHNLKLLRSLLDKLHDDEKELLKEWNLI